MFNNFVYEEYKDMFNYYNLITKINRGYRLYFNKKNRTFEVLNIFNNYESCLKFNSLSENILEKLQKSQIIFSNKIYDEIENNNEKISQDFENNLKYSTFCKLEEVSKFAKRTNKILKSDYKKIIEV